MSVVKREIEDARRRLIDLSLRNKFLNFKPAKRRTVTLAAAEIGEIYKTLVVNTKKARILPRDTQEEAPHADESFILRADLNDAELGNKIPYLYRLANAVIDEQGYNALHLAVPFLLWREHPSSIQTHKAPLLLIPVRLRRSFRGTYELEWTEEEVQRNEPLAQKLEEQGIQLPDFEMGENPNCVVTYLDQVGEMISELQEWQVTKEEMYLDLFNFTKIVMSKDLDPKSWPEGSSPLEHHLLEKLFDGRAEPEQWNLFPEDEIDERFDLRERHSVLDADPSQMAVIQDAIAGRSFVVDGPPGTGKSQTIVNLIAEMVALGKKVLFVSEKRAALDVVKKRLDDVGLGPFCLELHSTRATRKYLVAQISETKNMKAPGRSGDRPAKKLIQARDSLNDYASALRTSYGNVGLSAYELLGMYEKARTHFERQGVPIPKFHIAREECQSWTKEEWSRAIDAIESLSHVFPGVVNEHPYYGCKPEGAGPFLADRLRELLDVCLKQSTALSEVLKQWERLGMRVSGTVAELEKIDQAAKVIQDSQPFQPVEPGILLRDTPSLQRDELLALVANISRCQKMRKDLEAILVESAFESGSQEVEEWKDKIASNLFILWHSKKHRELMDRTAALYHSQSEAPGTGQRQTDLKKLLEYCRLRDMVRLSKEDYKGVVGRYWPNDTEDPQRLTNFWDWREEFRRRLHSGIFTEETARALASTINTDRQLFLDQMKTFNRALQGVVDGHEEILRALGASHHAIFGQETHDTRLSDLTRKWQLWRAHLGVLSDWMLFLDRRERCLRTIAAKFITFAEQASMISKDDLVPGVTVIAARAMLESLFLENTLLANFKGQLHELMIKDFKVLDEQWATRNRERLTQRLLEKRPALDTTQPRESPENVLKLELVKTKHMPIRKLFSRAGEVILGFRPCCLMSPLSVAQFLEPGRAQFDVVIFDEASQVRPEDALGAILRGKQVIVLGDEKQLPPTKFFDHLIEEDEYDDELPTMVGIMPSVLSLCKHNLPARTLKWHYRSKHESLIAVSNQEFYANTLRTYPSPKDRDEDLGLRFKHFPDGVYDRGRTRTNRNEAALMAREAFNHYERNPKLSLGIGTFNTEQREAVLDEIDKLLRDRPDMEGWFSRDRDEPFFVKNLETIQGDERDVILISVGYGFNENRTLTMNFGPLNQEGGERRLNVLITRARSKCVVFANFRGSDLSVTDQSPKGVKALKVFLDFAEMGKLESDRAPGFDSPFEEEVYRALIDRNFMVQPQVGCATYRIDLAIPHPNILGRYVLGIECDGKNYHSSRVARARDRLRQQVLERLGWRIHRVWSTDWFNAREKTQNRLFSVIEESLAQCGQEAKLGGHPPDQPPPPDEPQNGGTEIIVKPLPEEPHEPGKVVVPPPVVAPRLKTTNQAKWGQIEASVDGNLLTLMIDLTGDLGVSSTGKTKKVALTGGAQKVPGSDVRINLTVLRPIKAGGRKGKLKAFTNVETELHGDRFEIRIDLTKTYGLSKSQKTTKVASTNGHQSIYGRTELLNLNAWRKNE